MNRLEALTGATLAALLAAGGVQKYRELSRVADTPAPPRGTPETQEELRPVRTVDAAVAAYVSAAENANHADRIAHLGTLLSALESPELEGDGLEPATAERLARLVAETLTFPESGDPETRRRALGQLASRVPSRTSRELVLKALDEEPEATRLDLLARLGSPEGVRGRAVYEKVLELGRKGLVPDELLPKLLRRTGGTKAKEELVTLMEGSVNSKLLAGCAVSLQDYRDPELLGPVFERLEEVGMLEPGKLPWISPTLLDEHLKTADRPRFRRGIAAMAARPSLVAQNISHAERALGGEDAETRRHAAVAVKKAVVARLVDAKKGEDLLAGRLSVETEPVLKAELTGGLERVRSLLEQKETGVQ